MRFSSVPFETIRSHGTEANWGLHAKAEERNVGIATLDTVADLNTPLPNGIGSFGRAFGVPVIDGGNVAFSGGNGIYTVIGGIHQVVADRDTLGSGLITSSTR